MWCVALVAMCLFLGAIVGRRRVTERLFRAAYALCGSSAEAEAAAATAESIDSVMDEGGDRDVPHQDAAPGRRDTGAPMRRTGSRGAAGVVSVLCLLLAFAGCGGDERADGAGIQPLAAATGRPEIHRLKVGAGPITDLKQLYFADAKGFFREEGLEVDIVNLEAPGTVIPAVVSGDLDLGWSNSLSLLQARARGLDMRFFAGGVYQRPGHWNSAIMVREDSPIRTPEQLRGRTIAINSLANINELVIRAYLDREGVAPDAYQLLEVPFPDQPAALETGRVDAILPTEPFVSVAEQGGARTVHAQPFTVIGPDAFVAGFFTSEGWLREHPNTAAAFRRAINRATAYWNDDPDKRAEIIARYTKVPAAVAEEIVFAEPRTEISEADVQRQIELAHDYDLLPKTFDAADVLTR